MRGHPRFGFRTLGMMVRLSHRLYGLRLSIVLGGCPIFYRQYLILDWYDLS